MKQERLIEIRGRLDELSRGQAKLPVGEAASLLSEIWDDLCGSDDTSMSTEKLHRLEEPVWESPVLRFKMERHGGTVMGSSRADMYTWSINLRDGSARCTEDGYRQIYRRQKPLRVGPLCEKVVALIESGRDHEYLKWSADKGRVTVRIGEVIPNDAVEQTVVGRRKRFRKALEPALSERGWRLVSGTTANTYERIA